MDIYTNSSPRRWGRRGGSVGLGGWLGSEGELAWIGYEGVGGNKGVLVVSDFANCTVTSSRYLSNPLLLRCFIFSEALHPEKTFSY